MPPLSFRFYTALSALAAPALLPRLRRGFAAKGGDPARWPERLGREAGPRPDGAVIWVHAVSVGEMGSALPLVEALLAERPDATVLLTTTTATSADLAARRLPEGAVHRFAPLDHRPAVARFLDHWRPERAIFLESEVWPVQVAELARRGIPLALVSARLTARSADRWRRLAPGLARWTFGRIPLVLAQEAATATRARDLGAPRVEVSGSLKAAAARLPVDPAARDALARALGTRPVWVAASTHAGEEPAIAAAQARVLERHPEALCILAPRHADRAEAILPDLAGLTVAQRSRGDRPGSATQLYLADTLGEMGLWYDLAPVVFLGGSLMPGIGGHNPLEPAAFGCALLTGPHTANAQAEFARLIAAGQAARVADADALGAAVAERLAAGAPDRAAAAAADPDLATRVARACLALR